MPIIQHPIIGCPSGGVNYCSIITPTSAACSDMDNNNYLAALRPILIGMGYVLIIGWEFGISMKTR